MLQCNRTGKLVSGCVRTCKVITTRVIYCTCTQLYPCNLIHAQLFSNGEDCIVQIYLQKQMKCTKFLCLFVSSCYVDTDQHYFILKEFNSLTASPASTTSFKEVTTDGELFYCVSGDRFLIGL